MATKDDLPLLMNTSVVRFKSLDEKELDIYFLAWLLRSPKFIEEVKSYSSGTAQKNVGPTHLKLISISYPPLSEQKRIVKILDEAFKKIEKVKENSEKNLENSKNIYESYLNSIFINPNKDWEKKKLKDICDKLFAGGDVPKKNLSKSKTEKYSIPIYANGFKDKGLYGYTDIKKVIKPSITISARGTIGYAEVREEPFFPVVRLIVLTPNEKMNLYFLYYLTHNFKFSNTGTSIPQLTIPLIENIMIPVPPIREQKILVEKINSLLEQTKKLEKVYRQKLADLEELKKSVLNKAFTGEL
jgi:type I restriction enzyme S subunit